MHIGNLIHEKNTSVKGKHLININIFKNQNVIFDTNQMLQPPPLFFQMSFAEIF